MPNEPDFPSGGRAEVIALTVGQRNIAGWLRGDREPVVVRPQTRVWDVVEGETATLGVMRTWSFGRTRYVSATIEDVHLDVESWGLPPLSLTPVGRWDPRDLEDLNVRRRSADDPVARCLRADLRCIDAHTHLGHLNFRDGRSGWGADRARKHYMVGVAVGDRALGADFRGVLPWGCMDNRPFLRCLHGLGLATWRLGDLDGGRRVMERLLWLEPEDPMGARFLLASISEGRPYAPEG